MRLKLMLYCVAFMSFLTIAGQACFGGNEERTENKKMKYILTELEYPVDALEPWIDSETVAIHHGKHQAAYVANLNKALESEPNFKFDGSVEALISGLDKVPENIRTAVRNNGGGVWNHTFYWRGLSPEKSEPSPELMAAIKESFGSFEELKKQMNAAAVGRFGSGWAWLGVSPDGKLKICSTPNQDAPIMGEAVSACNMIPILTIDVWEHAYYLKYQNRRPEYAECIWNIVNWKRVSERYQFAVDKKKVLL